MNSWRDGAVAVLMNPTAARGRHAGRFGGVLDLLAKSGREIRPLSADSPEQAVSEARRAVEKGAGAVVAVGGDGTVHLALQAVAETGVPLGIVPAGTGNDFAVELGLPKDPLTATEQLAKALRDDTTRDVDLGLVEKDGEKRWFGAVLGAGFDAIVNERANAMRFPRGPIKYDLAILLELIRLRPRDYTLTVDGVAQEVTAVLLAIGNTASYGGGMRICPDADPTDGRLDIVYAEPLSRLTLMRIKPSVYAGTHVHNHRVRTVRATTIELAGPELTTYVDGERGLPLPVRVTSKPGALRLHG